MTVLNRRNPTKINLNNQPLAHEIMGLTKHCLVALLFLRAAIGGPGPSLPFGMKGKPMGETEEREWNT